MTRSTYQIVTDRIISALETAEANQWERPWARTGLDMPLRSNGEPYRGVNTLLLWCAAREYGFTSPYWLTSKMIRDYDGAHVPEAQWHRNGGPGNTLVTFYGEAKKKDAEPGANGEQPCYRFLKWYTVWNASQVEGLPARFYPSTEKPNIVADFSAFEFASRCGAKVETQGERACYVPSADLIRMPESAAFTSQAGYDGTLLHELTHWTGHETRLDRLSEKNAFGSEGYAFEELIAEIGATFLCASLGREYRLENHASYLASWLKVLRHDNKAILRAASAAQKASDYCLKANAEALAA